jgi:hypothetical protein
LAIKQQIVSDARGDSEFNVTDRVQTEVTMQNRLIEMPTLIQGLRSDSELLSGIRSRGADFLIAMREALPNALTHGYQSEDSKRVFRLLCLRGQRDVVDRDAGRRKWVQSNLISLTE